MVFNLSVRSCLFCVVVLFCLEIVFIYFPCHACIVLCLYSPVCPRYLYVCVLNINYDGFSLSHGVYYIIYAPSKLAFHGTGNTLRKSLYVYLWCESGVYCVVWMGCSASLSKHEATVILAPKERAKIDRAESVEHLSWCSRTSNTEHDEEYRSDLDSTSSTSSVYYDERLARVESGADLSWCSVADLKPPRQETNQQLPDKSQKQYYCRPSRESVDHLSWCSLESATKPTEVRIEVSSGSDLCQPQASCSVHRPVGKIREDVIAHLNKLASFVGIDEFLEVLKTLRDLYNDIIQHPNDDKHCQIKLANKTFSSTVWRYPACEELMKISGWVVEDNHIRLRDDSYVLIVFQQLDTFSQLLSASRNGHSKTMVELLNDYNKSGLDLPYLPALLFAAISGEQLTVVNILVKQYDADLNCLTSEGEACIFYAIDNATESFTIKLLTDYSIDTAVTADDETVAFTKQLRMDIQNLLVSL